MNKDGYPDPTAEKAIHNIMRGQKKMELEDTIQLMLSAYYKDRFKAEYYQTKIRYAKLIRMVNNWDNLSFEPTCSKETYICQLEAMREYINILESRAKTERIELDGNL